MPGREVSSKARPSIFVMLQSLRHHLPILPVRLAKGLTKTNGTQLHMHNTYCTQHLLCKLHYPTTGPHAHQLLRLTKDTLLVLLKRKETCPLILKQLLDLIFKLFICAILLSIIRGLVQPAVAHFHICCSAFNMHGNNH